MKKGPKLTKYTLAILMLLSIFAAEGLSQETAAQKRAKAAEKIKNLEQKEEETKSIIEKTEEGAKRAEEEAEKVKWEKEKLEEEARIKEEQAAVTKKEAELVKKEAEVKNDTGLIKEAQKLATEAEILEEEASIDKEKAKVVESKESLALKKLESQKKRIDTLTERLKGIRIEKNAMASLLEKIAKSAPVIITGLVIFLFMKIILRKLEDLLSKKQAIRDDELTLRMKTLSKLVNWLGSIVIFVVIFYIVLENFGFSIAPLIAGAGIVGLAFGFGGQYLIRDLINGLFILL